ncbi:MAG: formate dehydrogenase subunit alpha [Omnitrophica bacterium RIFCSPLOWO2_12_FULL_45_13]|nr:MAG: formate dehydrogenase subunit alpha [Omnitrophica bacterium RIFCSPLOWO2_12_FULL_45_13]
MKRVLTTCPYCGVGCGFYLDVRDGRIVGVIPSKSNSVSKGNLCVKGWHAHEPVQHPDRLKKPLIKENGKFLEVSWERALDYTAKRLKEIKDKYGPDSLAVCTSARCTNEENFVMMKFARAVLGTNNVDHCARTCHVPTVSGLNQSFGSGASTNSYDELPQMDCILIIGSNPTEAHPIVGWRVRTAIDNGAQVIVCDPRKILLAESARFYIQHYPGSDIALINAMINYIVTNNLHDKEFIHARTEGFNELWEMVKDYTPESVKDITGVEPELLKQAAKLYATSKKSCIMYSLGITEHTVGTNNVISMANLAMITGHVGKEFSGVYPMRGQNNVQGSCDMGALPNVYSGYQPVTDEQARKRFETAWAVRLPSKPGLTLTDMMAKAIEGVLKCFYIIGEDQVRTDPNTHMIERALKSLEFLVIQEIFLSETAKLADVILPGASFAEKDGTFTCAERRFQRVRKAIEPIAGKTDGEIICELSNRLGYQMEPDPKKVCDEMASLTPIYAGVSFERLEENGLQWPVPAKNHPGTPVVHLGKFKRGLGKFIPVKHRPPAEVPDREYPFILSTGRTLFHYNTGTMTRRVTNLLREFPRNFVQINSADAENLGIKRRQKVMVKTRRGELTVEAEVTEKIKKGVLWMPFHFSDEPTNVLTNSAFDPVCKIGEYKACAASISKANL